MKARNVWTRHGTYVRRALCLAAVLGLAGCERPRRPTVASIDVVQSRGGERSVISPVDSQYVVGALRTPPSYTRVLYSAPPNLALRAPGDTAAMPMGAGAQPSATDTSAVTKAAQQPAVTPATTTTAHPARPVPRASDSSARARSSQSARDTMPARDTSQTQRRPPPA